MLDKCKITVNPWAINSSGTNSGRNRAGVIHGHRVFTGSKVTMTSPLAKFNVIEIDRNAS